MLATLLVMTALAHAPAEVPPYHAPLTEVALESTEERLLSTVLRLFERAEERLPRLDPGLVVAARRAAEALQAGAGTGSASQVVSAALQSAGVTDATTYPFALRTIAGGAPPSGALSTLVVRHVVGRNVTHVGVGRSPHPLPCGEHVVVVLFVERLAVLEPLPRSVVGVTAPVLSGRVAPHTTDVAVLLGLPDGSVTEPRVRRGGDGAFACALPLTGGPGSYDVEVLATGHHGVQVANLFPLLVGGDALPHADRILPVVRLLPGDAAGLGPADLARALTARVNHTRAARGLAPLAPAPRLAAVAARHGADMVRRGYFGHRSPEGALVQDRLRRSGLSPAGAAEVLAIAPSTAEAHDRLIQSPSHRRLLLDPALRRIGVSVTAVADGTQRRLVVAAILAP